MFGSPEAYAWSVVLLWIGWALTLAGLALTVAAAWTIIGRGRATSLPFDPPRALVIRGPYRWLRNPIYLGDFLVLLGMGLALAWPGGLLLAVGFLACMHAYVVLWEEGQVERRFGSDYVDYKRSVPRWFPNPLRRR